MVKIKMPAKMLIRAKTMRISIRVNEGDFFIIIYFKEVKKNSRDGC